MNLTESRRQEFIAALEKTGGSSGNGSLRQALGWDEEFYWKVQGHLISEGRLRTPDLVEFKVSQVCTPGGDRCRGRWFRWR
jgi:hypothetical protein